MNNETIEDGFGMSCSAWCPDCKQKAMQIVRPGKAQCAYCNGAYGTLTATKIDAAITRDTEWDTVAEIETATGAVNILLETEIDASSELLALMDDETGTGALVFGSSPTIASPTFSGTIAGTYTIGGTPTFPSTVTLDAEWDTIAEIEAATGSINILLETEIDASSELRALMDDESGTGALLFEAGNGATLTLDASGFNGNLATTDNTLQEIAQKLDDLSTGGLTAWTDIGDASGDTTIALGAHETDFTSTIDASGEAQFTFTNTDADAANDNSFIDLRHNDGADANVFYLRLIGDNDGTPTNDYLLSQTAFSIGSGVTTTFAGAVNLNGTTTAGTVNTTTFQIGGVSITSSAAELNILDGATLDVTELNYVDGVTSALQTQLNAKQGLTHSSANDPDISTEGHLAWDANGDVLRGYDGTNQVAVGRKIEAIHCTVVLPNDLADSERDAFWIWENVSGMSFIVTGWAAKSDTDDTTLNIEEIDTDGANNATVDAVEIATNGTGLFYATDTTITAATIENGHLLVLDFDDTDTPGQVKITIYGYYNADVN